VHIFGFPLNFTSSVMLNLVFLIFCSVCAVFVVLFLLIGSYINKTAGGIELA